jgi:antitoxin MazE
MVIRSRIVRIGNSRGLRIPKQVLDQLRLGEDVELEVLPDQLVVRPAHRPRAQWDERFRAMAERGDDQLLDGDALAPTRWEDTELEW